MFQMGMNEKIRQRPMEDFLAIFQIQLWNAILKKKDPDSLIMEQFKLWLITLFSNFINKKKKKKKKRNKKGC